MVKNIKKVLQKSEIGLLVFYKKFISPLLYTIFKGGCRYDPTCSEYGILAIKKYGPFKGLSLTLIRFLSCNPFSTHPREHPLK